MPRVVTHGPACGAYTCRRPLEPAPASSEWDRWVSSGRCLVTEAEQFGGHNHGAGERLGFALGPRRNAGWGADQGWGTGQGPKISAGPMRAGWVCARETERTSRRGPRGRLGRCFMSASPSRVPRDLPAHHGAPNVETVPWLSDGLPRLRWPCGWPVGAGGRSRSTARPAARTGPGRRYSGRSEPPSLPDRGTSSGSSQCSRVARCRLTLSLPGDGHRAFFVAARKSTTLARWNSLRAAAMAWSRSTLACW